MKSLKELTELAMVLCGSERQTMDIYKSGRELRLKPQTSRNSGKYLRRVTYEKGNVIVREFTEEGKPAKVIETRPVKKTEAKVSKSEKPVEKKETPKEEPKKVSDTK